MPPPIDGPIPKLGTFKTRLRFDSVFKYVDGQYSTILDLFWYLLSDQERSLLTKLGIPQLTYRSHAHGVAVGKALTE
jgi:hypothetical protein